MALTHTCMRISIIKVSWYWCSDWNASHVSKVNSFHVHGSVLKVRFYCKPTDLTEELVEQILTEWMIVLINLYYICLF